MEEAEAKLLEKFREMVAHRDFRAGTIVARTFQIPNPMDSEEMISIDLGLRCSSVVPETKPSGRKYVTSYGGVL